MKKILQGYQKHPVQHIDHIAVSSKSRMDAKPKLQNNYFIQISTEQEIIILLLRHKHLSS